MHVLPPARPHIPGQSGGLGDLLRSYRARHRLTQTHLAYRIGFGMSQADVSKLENGYIVLPRHDRLQRIAQILDIEPGDVLLAAGRHATATVALATAPGQERPVAQAPGPPSIEVTVERVETMIADVEILIREIRAQLRDLTARS